MVFSFVPNFSEQPIVRSTLAHTGRLDGDDTGFRDVAHSPYDAADPDPLVVVNGRVKCYPISGKDEKDNYQPKISDGARPEDRILLREPALKALEEANNLLQRYGRELVVIDGFRPIQRQARSFGRVMRRFLGERDYHRLPVIEQLKLGRQTNAAILFVAVIRDDRYQQAVAAFRASRRQDELAAVGEQLHEPAEQLVTELLTYEANYGLNDLTLDTVSHTAHGNGGATDVCLVDTATGRFVNRGIPFSYNNVSAVMDYFEWATVEQYQQEANANSPLAAYLRGYGFDRVIPEAMTAARTERRILFHAMSAVGASFFSLHKTDGECWHFNLGNERGGKQFDKLPHGGNAPHALLKNVRDAHSGQITACWENAVAHRLAEALMQ